MDSTLQRAHGVVWLRARWRSGDNSPVNVAGWPELDSSPKYWVDAQYWVIPGWLLVFSPTPYGETGQGLGHLHVYREVEYRDAPSKWWSVWIRLGDMLYADVSFTGGLFDTGGIPRVERLDGHAKAGGDLQKAAWDATWRPETPAKLLSELQEIDHTQIRPFDWRHKDPWKPSVLNVS